MSSRRRLPVELSPDAQDDYTGILFYSAEQWGNTQRDTYNAALERALRRIGDHPRIGPARPEIGTGVRSVLVREHVVSYRIEADKIRVLRILHQRMDAASHLRNL
jgi:toxin ParE1/3/4